MFRAFTNRRPRAIPERQLPLPLLPRLARFHPCPSDENAHQPLTRPSATLSPSDGERDRVRGRQSPAQLHNPGKRSSAVAQPPFQRGRIPATCFNARSRNSRRSSGSWEPNRMVLLLS